MTKIEMFYRCKKCKRPKTIWHKPTAKCQNILCGSTEFEAYYFEKSGRKRIIHNTVRECKK